MSISVEIAVAVPDKNIHPIKEDALFYRRNPVTGTTMGMEIRQSDVWVMTTGYIIGCPHLRLKSLQSRISARFLRLLIVRGWPLKQNLLFRLIVKDRTRELITITAIATLYLLKFRRFLPWTTWPMKTFPVSHNRFFIPCEGRTYLELVYSKWVKQKPQLMMTLCCIEKLFLRTCTFQRPTFL